MTSSNKGFDIMTGLYTTRYYARKAATGADIVVKVCGGYTIMTAADYNIWRRQRWPAFHSCPAHTGGAFLLPCIC